MKILFQGDSLTECNRDKSNPDDLGNGYVAVASRLIAQMFPDKDFTFINRGVGGDRTWNLLERWQEEERTEIADMLNARLESINEDNSILSDGPIDIPSVEGGFEGGFEIDISGFDE